MSDDDFVELNCHAQIERQKQNEKKQNIAFIPAYHSKNLKSPSGVCQSHLSISPIPCTSPVKKKKTLDEAPTRCNLITMLFYSRQ